ncbi:MFS transporter [Paenalcaligenes niemegkensis]|uniref:MFS transporter n=1 Tax=Paenalcaligenes niemegkensis TaxID=2895469 RepID=UPI001EE9296E|nr:MFS transporter [Paenalcaligenes niemegkensis]MCQ9616664.1 MFS transporter [Paenalcaligenes niemegkensis]
MQNKTRWVSVVVLIFCGIVAAMQMGKVAIGAPLLQHQLGFSFRHIGWLTALFSVLGMVGGIPLGTLVMRYGQRRAVILGLCLLAVASVASTWGESLRWLLSWRAVEGLGFIMVTISCPALVDNATAARHKDTAMSMWSCFMPLGMATSMLIGGWFSDWKLLWWVCASLPLVALGLVLWLSSAPPSDRTILQFKEIGLQLKQLLAAKIAPAFASIFAFYAVMYFALFSFLPLLLVEQMGLSVREAGSFTAIATLANVIGNLGAGQLVSRGVSRGTLLSTACIIMMFCGASLFFANPAPLASLLLCLVFSGVGGLVPATIVSAVPRIAPSVAAVPVTIGLTMQGSNLGQVMGPALVGSSVDSFGWPSAGIVIVVSGLLACILIKRYVFTSKTV